MAYQTFITPIGICHYPWFRTPNKWNHYETKLELPEDQAQELLSQHKKIEQAEYGRACRQKGVQSLKRSPHTPWFENEDGILLFKFKMDASGVNRTTGEAWTARPKLYDAKNREIKDVQNRVVMSGTTARIKYSVEPYCTALGFGLSLRLRAAQLIQIVGDDGGFPVEEDGYEHPSGPKPNHSDVSEMSGTTFADGETIDDLPF